MARRIALEVGLILAITVAIAWLVLGALALTDSADPIGTFFDQTFRVLFGLLGIALAVWSVLLIIGSIVLRRRGAGVRIASHLVSLVIALVVNVALLAVVTFAANGGSGDSWGLLVVGIAGAAGVPVFIAGVVAVLVVELRVLRPKAAASQ